MENLKAKIRHVLKTSLYTEANAATLYKICLLESTIFLTPSVSPSIRHKMVITAVNTINSVWNDRLGQTSADSLA